MLKSPLCLGLFILFPKKFFFVNDRVVPKKCYPCIVFSGVKCFFFASLKYEILQETIWPPNRIMSLPPLFPTYLCYLCCCCSRPIPAANVPKNKKVASSFQTPPARTAKANNNKWVFREPLPPLYRTYFSNAKHSTLIAACLAQRKVLIVNWRNVWK